MNFSKTIEAVLAILFTIVLLGLLLGLPTLLLWNWLMPTLFGLKTIGFWQAVGVNIFAGVLFRSKN